MREETEFVYDLEATVSFLNQDHLLKPYGYQAIFEQLAEHHLSNLESNVDRTMEFGLAWALISMTFEIENPIDSCMKLQGATWYSQRRGPYFRRELIVKNLEGQVMFKGSTYSVLLDIEKRTVFRKKEIPFPVPVPTEIFLVDATPGFKTPLKFEPVENRIVRHSYIDCLGHVNNCRYGEFAYDALSDDETNRLKDLTRMEIYFQSEMRQDDNFAVEKAYDENRIFFRGSNKTKDDVSFNIVMGF